MEVPRFQDPELQKKGKAKTGERSKGRQHRGDEPYPSLN